MVALTETSRDRLPAENAEKIVSPTQNRAVSTHGQVMVSPGGYGLDT
jgi:hypothetical protein